MKLLSYLFLINFLFLFACNAPTSDPTVEINGVTAELPDDQKDIDNKIFRMAVSDKSPRACFKDVDFAEADMDMTDAPEDSETIAAGSYRIMIAVDGSGSMGAQFGGKTKAEAAREATLAFLSEVNDATEVGLIAFGHKGSNEPAGKSASCDGTEIIRPVGKINRDALKTDINRIKPTGYTPLAAAIQTAADQMQPSENEGDQMIWVVSDGKETCGGDPVKTAREVNQGSLKLVVNIVGFDLQADDREQLKAVAAAGGGEFMEVTEDKVSAVERLRWSNANRFAALRESNKTIFDNLRKSNDAVFTAIDCTVHLVREERESLQTYFRKNSPLQGADKEEYDEARRLLRARHDKIRDFRTKYKKDIRDDRKEIHEETQQKKDEIFEETEREDEQN